MGSYANVAVRDAAGTIIGYQSTSTGLYSPGTGGVNYTQQAAPTVSPQALAGVPTQNPYGSNNAAAIIWQNQHYGGAYANPVSESLASVAAREGYTGTVQTVSGRSTVPTPDITYAASQPTNVLASSLDGNYVNSYAPLGNYAQVEIPNSKLVVSEAGEVGIYGQQYVGGQLSRYLTLQSSGGRNALQSGAFSINGPITTRVYGQSDLAKFVPASSNDIATKSRLGAEAYGGYAMQPLDSRTIESTGAKLSTYSNRNDLANLVSPEAVNLGKSELPGAKIPWTVKAESPTIQYADQYGLTGKNINIVGSQPSSLPQPFISSVPMASQQPSQSLPTPFVSQVQQQTLGQQAIRAAEQNPLVAAAASIPVVGAVVRPAVQAGGALVDTLTGATPLKVPGGIKSAAVGTIPVVGPAIQEVGLLIDATQGKSPIKSTDIMSQGQSGRLQSVIQAYGAGTDITVGTITGLGGLSPSTAITPFKDLNAKTGLGSQNQELAAPLIERNNAIVAEKNFAQSYDFGAAEKSLAAEKLILELTANPLNASSESLKKEYSDIEAMRTGLDTTSTSAVSEFNAKVAAYNIKSSLLESSSKDLQKQIDIYNQNVETYGSRVEQLKGLESNVKSSEIAAFNAGSLEVQGGKLVESPLVERPYGAFSDWSKGASEVILGDLGLTRAQVLQGENLYKDDLLGSFGYGAFKEATLNPGNVVASAISGVQFAAVGGAAAETLKFVGAGSSILAPAARTALAIGESTPAKVAMVGGIGALTYAGASKGFTASPSETAMNLGGASVDLAAMGVGGVAFAASPRAFASAAESARNAKLPTVEDLIGPAGPGGVIRSKAVGYDSESGVMSFGGSAPKTPTVIFEEALQRAGITESTGSITKTPYTPLKSYIPTIDLTEVGLPSGNKIPMEHLPGVKLMLSGEDVIPYEHASAFGKLPATVEQQRVVAEFKRLGGIESEIYGLGESPRTQQFKLARVGTTEGQQPPVAFESLKLASSVVSDIPETPLSFNLKVESVSPKGLESKYGGAPMSQRMFDQVVTQPAIKSSGVGISFDEAISKMEIGARVKPAVSQATQQRILPSATTSTFREPTISKLSLEEMVGILSEEKRPSGSKIASTKVESPIQRISQSIEETPITKTTGYEGGTIVRVEPEYAGQPVAYTFDKRGENAMALYETGRSSNTGVIATMRISSPASSLSLSTSSEEASVLSGSMESLKTESRLSSVASQRESAIERMIVPDMISESLKDITPVSTIRTTQATSQKYDRITMPDAKPERLTTEDLFRLPPSPQSPRSIEQSRFEKTGSPEPFTGFPPTRGSTGGGFPFGGSLNYGGGGGGPTQKRGFKFTELFTMEFSSTPSFRKRRR